MALTGEEPTLITPGILPSALAESLVAAEDREGRVMVLIILDAGSWG